MKNLKNKILNALNQNDKVDGILNNLSDYKKKLSKNLTNPIFSKNAKNQILKMCADLQKLEDSLYRYNVTNKFNNSSSSQKEKEIAKDIVLKDDICNVKFVWRSELSEKTCDECSDLDGQEFDLYDDIPPMPHPNCKCYIDVVSYNTSTNKKIDVPSQKTTAKNDTTGSTNTNTSTETNTTKTPGKWIMPCNGKILSSYGWRIHPIYKTRIFHKGIDIEAKIGTSVKTIADGVVIYAGNNDPKGYGNYVVINHGKINGVIVTSEYGHLSSWNVKAGQKVTQGQVIAKSGNTGGSTGPHVHVTIKENGNHVSPNKYIPY